jgi:uncharacterized protein (UPF0261 family)
VIQPVVATNAEKRDVAVMRRMREASAVFVEIGMSGNDGAVLRAAVATRLVLGEPKQLVIAIGNDTCP